VTRRVFVAGVGMTKFAKPGSHDHDYPELAQLAVQRAFADCELTYADVEQVCAGYVYGDSTAGQRALYGLGLTGVSILNLNNNCATGSTALNCARQLVEGGLADCTLAVGFEKMAPGSIPERVFADRAGPLDRHTSAVRANYPSEGAPFAVEVFGAAGREHMRLHGTEPEHFARIAEKNHRHSTRNPYAQFQKEFSLQQVLSSDTIYSPLTKLQCSPTSDGAAAAVICSEAFLEERELADRAVELVAQCLVTDGDGAFSGGAIDAVGAGMTRRAAEAVYERAGLGPESVDVIELHDCFSTNELISYEALGLCAEGEGAALVDDGETTYGGRWVVNPSGGLISKGHPLGATGLAQCSELCWQLRGKAEERQVEGASVGLQHNIGLGGAAVVTLYRRP
jgi:acetyl-CoA acyltransferase